MGAVLAFALTLTWSGATPFAALVASSLNQRLSAAGRILLQSPGGDDAAAIRGLLQRFADAYTAKDASAIKSMFRDANETLLKRQFADMRRLRVELQECQPIEFKGNVASVSCTWSVEYEAKVGAPQPRTTRAKAFVLEKVPGGWTIKSQGGPS